MIQPVSLFILFTDELRKQELEDNKNDLPSMDSETSEDEVSDSDDDE